MPLTLFDSQPGSLVIGSLPQYSTVVKGLDCTVLTFIEITRFVKMESQCLKVFLLTFCHYLFFSFCFFVFYCSCSSNIGRIGGRQVISVGSIGTEFSDRSCMTPTPYGSNVTITCTKGNILHEIGHALGYYHEHNRPDRDEYLTVVWKNVIPGNKTFTTYLRWYTSNITSFTTQSLE